MFIQLSNSICNLFSSIFKFKSTKIENQTTTNLISDKKDYKEATNIAEKIISITNKYKHKMSFADRLKYCHLSEKFQKFN